QPRDMGGRSVRGGTAAVVQAHDPFHYRDIGARGAVQEKRRDELLPAQHRVEVTARPPGGERVVTRVDVVGTDLVTGHRQAPGVQRRHQPGGNGCLAMPRCRGGDNEPGRGHHSMPPWPFWPLSMGCLILVMSTTRSASSISR